MSGWAFLLLTVSLAAPAMLVALMRDEDDLR